MYGLAFSAIAAYVVFLYAFLKLYIGKPSGCSDTDEEERERLRRDLDRKGSKDEYDED